MNTFAEFIEKSKSTLCKEYTEKLDKAGSKVQFINLALDANGLPWVAESVAKGELPIEVIANDFKPFLNGKYTRIGDGFTSQIYCRPPEDKIEITTTATLIIDFDGVVKVDRPCELYIVNSKVMIVGNGNPQVYAYNSEVEHPNLPIKIVEDKKY